MPGISYSFFFGLLFIFIQIASITQISTLFIISINLVALTSLTLIFTNKNQPFSLCKQVYLFYFIFFGIVPCVNEISGVLFWGGQTISESAKLYTNLILLLGLFAFYFGSKIPFQVSTKKQDLNKIDITVLKPRFFLMIIILFFSSYLILDYNSFDYRQFLFKNISEEFGGNTFSPSTTEMLLIGNFVRPIPIFIFFLFYLSLKTTNHPRNWTLLNWLSVVLLFLIAVIFAFPTSLARYMAAILYVPFIIVFTRIFDNRWGFVSTMLISLVIIMPVLDIFRRYQLEPNSVDINLNYFNTANFDAYQNFSRVIESDFITWGNQLIGVLAFFIPRSIWPEKPIGSGAQYAIDHNLAFSNISMPYVAEGFVNFGVVGVLIFMFLLGSLLGMFDRKCWNLIWRTGKDGYLQYYYYFILSLIFFIMRGDLLSGFAYFCGITSSYLFITLAFKKSKILVRN